MGVGLERKKEGNAAKNLIKGNHHKNVEETKWQTQPVHVKAAVARYELRVEVLCYEQS